MVKNLKLVHSHLQEASAFFTAVGANVWMNTLPPHGDFDNSSPGVVISLVNERQDPNGAHHVVDVDAECFGGDSTEDAADNIHRLLYDHVHGAGPTTLTEGTIDRAYVRGSRRGNLRAGLGWPSVRVQMRYLITGA